MARYTNKGTVIEIDLGNYGYSSFFAEVLYKYVEEKNATEVTMYVVCKGEDGTLVSMMPVQNTQYISSNKNTAKQDILRIVRYMCDTGIIKEYLPVAEDADE